MLPENADIVLVGIADGAMQLQRVAHDLVRDADGARLGAGDHRRLHGLLVPGNANPMQQRTVELEIDEIVREAMLQRLETAERLAELPPRLHMLQRQGQRALAEAEQLDGAAERQEIAEPGATGHRLLATRDHHRGVAGRDARRARAVDIRGQRQAVARMGEKAERVVGLDQKIMRGGREDRHAGQ